MHSRKTSVSLSKQVFWENRMTITGKKNDEGKPPLTLFPRTALEQAAEVFAFGANKYGKYNYKQGFEYTRLLDAALRHVNAYADGEDLDPESGKSHLAHALCSIAMLLECQKIGTAKDDRYKR